MVEQFPKRLPLALPAILGLVVVAGVLVVTLWRLVPGRVRRPTVTATPTAAPAVTPTLLGVRALYATLEAPRTGYPVGPSRDNCAYRNWSGSHSPRRGQHPIRPGNDLPGDRRSGHFGTSRDCRT